VGHRQQRAGRLHLEGARQRRAGVSGRQLTWSQSYNFRIYNYNASVVIG
jgi:hypothetical protein